jgi:hypothetical protein
MSQAIVIETFHCSYGTIPAGAEYDSDDSIVKEYPSLFRVIEGDMPADPEINDDYDTRSLKDLRDMAKSHGLTVTGSKDELIARLREYDRVAADES